MRRTAAIVAVAVTLALGACSGDGDDDAASDTNATAPGEPTTTTVSRPDGPAAELEELTAGDGVFIGSPTAYEPDEGYVEQEFAAAGTATS
jgi:hypothetical protein